MFPLEIITMLGSALLGGVLKLMGMKRQAEIEQNKALLSFAKIGTEDRKSARLIQIPSVQITRRFIAIIIVLAYVMPKALAAIAILFPELGAKVPEAYYCYMEEPFKFLFFQGTDKLACEPMNTLSVTPLDSHILYAIVGFYFGSKVNGS